MTRKAIKPNNKNKKKISDRIKELFWDKYTYNTNMLSSICRQLSFAEGGVCWFFMKSEKPDIYNMTTDIKVILVFLVLFFIFDAFQYFSLANRNEAIALFYEQQQNDGLLKDENSVKRPPWINHGGQLCFIAKLTCIFIASFLLIGKFIFQFFIQ